MIIQPDLNFQRNFTLRNAKSALLLNFRISDTEVIIDERHWNVSLDKISRRFWFFKKREPLVSIVYDREYQIEHMRTRLVAYVYQQDLQSKTEQVLEEMTKEFRLSEPILYKKGYL